jgi:hypothetical protein
MADIFGKTRGAQSPDQFAGCGGDQCEVDLPADLARFRLPEAVAARLQSLLDRQDSGQPLSAAEREEAEGLVNLAEFLTLLRLRADRLTAF